MTPQEEKLELRRTDPASWIVWTLAEEFSDRSLARNARMSSLIREVIRDAEARIKAKCVRLAEAAKHTPQALDVRYWMACDNIAEAIRQEQ